MNTALNAAIRDFTTAFTHNDLSFLIRPAMDQDQETLRRWKNSSKQFFHFQEEITPEMQTQWFNKFRTMPDRQMYVCLDGANAIAACVGFKAHQPIGGTHNILELFNLMALNPKYSAIGLTSAFYKTLVDFFALQSIQGICLEVLNSNKNAQLWYLKQGFVKYGEKPGCQLLIHRLGSVPI
jgi:ribosomal protein S18 acetylase RimI-like enzyme